MPITRDLEEVEGFFERIHSTKTDETNEVRDTDDADSPVTDQHTANSATTRSAGDEPLDAAEPVS